ncbi:hypothetical protein M5K25_023814 [Dendrobium thyrsiflorum]|uniref:ubiquitinyl hydrolase 1 n=1 Tax=Dendrobium thyrsiflorum TaxID=117978 RepID=A0ABD0U0N1_DENTH
MEEDNEKGLLWWLIDARAWSKEEEDLVISREREEVGFAFHLLFSSLLRSRCRDCTRRLFGSFVAVRLRSFDDFPFLSDRKLRHFDRKQNRKLAVCEGVGNGEERRRKDKRHFAHIRACLLISEKLVQKRFWRACREPLLNLEQDVTSHLVLKKIKELHEKYASFRRVRGDGNCFFRAFKFAYLEHILLMNDMGEANRILAKVEEFKYRILLDHMAPSETLISDYDAFCNIVTLVSSSSENRISHAVLLQWSKDEDGYSDPAIRFLRMVTSNEICKRQNHFEQSIQGLLCDDAMTVQKFCEIEVEPMDKDVDNVQIIAFVDALGVPIRIEYVQDSKHKLNHYDFGIEASALEEPYITLLYRPGHYDILYTKEYHVPVEVVLKDSEIPKKEPRTIAKELTKDYDGPTHFGCKDYQTEWTLPELIPQISELASKRKKKYAQKVGPILAILLTTIFFEAYNNYNLLVFNKTF